MLIEDLVEFCDEEYQNEECVNCTAAHLCNVMCGKDCKECLDDIHFHHNDIRNEYNCEKLLDYYVCRYTYKYCSEIIYALDALDFSTYPYFHILSLGCGGAPDLMAFDYMKYGQEISYVGCDNNVYWGKIHGFIQNHYHHGVAQFYRNVDVLTYFENHILEDTNVIIIQYLISFFYKEIGEKGVRKWFAQLARNIVKYKSNDSPILIIINDVDSINTGRDTFPLLVDEIQKVGLIVSTELRKRFKQNSYYENSVQYERNRNIFENEIANSFADNYCVAKHCESVQLILEVDS